MCHIPIFLSRKRKPSFVFGTDRKLSSLKLLKLENGIQHFPRIVIFDKATTEHKQQLLRARHGSSKYTPLFLRIGRNTRVLCH